MKLLSTIILFLVLLTSLNAAAFEKEIKSRSVVITLSSEKPLVVGNNTLIFKVKKDGQATSGDKITVKAFMPAMPGMPYMENKDEARELGDGVYESVVNFSMGGTWQIQIFVTPLDGKKYKVKTSVNI